MINKGSEWRKWDLHLHSPYTHMNTYSSTDEEFIKKIKLEEISVVGITNYFNFTDEEYLLAEKLKKENIVTFFNLEIRLSNQNNSNDCLDYHIIFSNELSVDEIKTFLQNLDIQVQGNNIKSINISTDNDYKYGVVDFEKLIETLEQESLGLKGKYLTGFLSRGKGNGRTSSIYERLTKKSDLIIHSSDSGINLKNDKDFWLKYNKPLLQNSDAHNLNDIGGKFTWIKADPTFEGLKQIIYEPEERIRIQEHKPADNLEKISEIELKFNDNVKIQQNGSVNSYDFCFSDVNQKLYLNNYFNCFIGGRGSGKSSLLNLIYCNITGKFDTEYLDKNLFENFEIKDDIIVDYKGEVEFLGQNKIEEFATDYVKFSKAIYKRLENKDELKKESKELEEYIFSLDGYISNILEIEKNNNDLVELQKKLSTYENILETVKSDEYNNITKDFDKYKKEYYEIESSKEKYTNIKNDFNIFLNNLSKINDENNDFDKKYNILLDSLKKISDKLESNDFSKIDSKQKEITEKGKEEKKKLDSYLEEKGLTEEKLKNLTEAQEGVHKLENEKEKINNDLQKYLELQKVLNIDEGSQLHNSYKNIIEKGLKKAEKILNEIQNDNIKCFKFNLVFNNDKAKEDLFENFMTTFKKYQEGRLIQNNISETLFQINIDEILNGKISKKIFTERIKQLGYGKGNDFLKSIFESESNFEIYKILIAKYLYNLNEYFKIEILYDNKPIEISSFGQKCTVVILIMLLFGNKPIIIDEPEAHLDSSLIANYLVDLIKKRKKERQIIFATHNANFVINGDAEQIYILENNHNKTNFTQTSIENLKNRAKLLKLEGGEDAFGLRGKKYKS